MADLMADPGRVAAVLRRMQTRQKQYQTFQDYYNGKHPLAFATPKFETAFGKLFKEFADNLCPAVVNAVRDRLEVSGFGVEGDKAGVAGEDAWMIWQENRLDALAKATHRAVLTKGDAYIIVWPDAQGNPKIFLNKADHIYVQYDAEDPERILWALKAWAIEADGYTRQRLNIYYPDRIEKYISPSSAVASELLGPNGMPLSSLLGGWERFQGPEDLSWPIPNPFEQVPVFHFANDAEPGDLGRSHLTDAVPIQDMLNKGIADTLVNMEYSAVPQRYVIGLERQYDDDTGTEINPFEVGAGRLWQAVDPEVKFGQFDAADSIKLIAVVNDARLEVARVTGTPLHYLMLQSGDFPSGEAQRAAETRHISIVDNAKVLLGNDWEDVMRFALRIRSEAVPPRLTTQWRDKTPRSEHEFAQSMQIKGQFISQEQVLREWGYSDEDIKRITEEKAAASQQAIVQQQQMAEATGKLFDRGEDPGDSSDSEAE